VRPSPHRLFKRPPPLLAGSASPPRRHGRPRRNFLLRTSPQPVRPPSPLHAPTDHARAAGQHTLAAVSPAHKAPAATTVGLRRASSPAALLPPTQHGDRAWVTPGRPRSVLGRSRPPDHRNLATPAGDPLEDPIARSFFFLWVYSQTEGTSVRN
jgi:hypothetical protein